MCGYLNALYQSQNSKGMFTLLYMWHVNLLKTRIHNQIVTLSTKGKREI